MQTDFTFSDTIAGYVTGYDAEHRSFGLRTSDDRRFEVHLTASTYARFTHNLGEDYRDATPELPRLLSLSRQFVFVYGTFYPAADSARFEAQWLVFPGEGPGRFRHEEPDWWIKQIRSIGNSYLRWQFSHPQQPIDYRAYRTMLHLAGAKKGDYLQETDTISRLVYGFASAYLLTGEDAFLEGAEKGTEYLRDHMRFYDKDENIVYWYHGIDIQGRAGDRSCSPPSSAMTTTRSRLYEQIYALAGPTQTYRITGDTRILLDIEHDGRPVRPVLPGPREGRLFLAPRPDHARPAQRVAGPQPRPRRTGTRSAITRRPISINLYLATGEQNATQRSSNTPSIRSHAHFPDYDHSPFVQEKLLRGLERTTAPGAGSRTAAVVGHNLKIAWNLMRMQALKAKGDYVAFARKIAELMPAVGGDLQRGGWYDVDRAGAQARRRALRASSGTTAKPGGSRSRASSPT